MKNTTDSVQTTNNVALCGYTPGCHDHTPHVCPHCGYCPTCGHGGFIPQPWPRYPYEVGDPIPMFPYTTPYICYGTISVSETATSTPFDFTGIIC